MEKLISSFSQLSPELTDSPRQSLRCTTFNEHEHRLKHNSHTVQLSANRRGGWGGGGIYISDMQTVFIPCSMAYTFVHLIFWVVSTRLSALIVSRFR